MYPFGKADLSTKSSAAFRPAVVSSAEMSKSRDPDFVSDADKAWALERIKALGTNRAALAERVGMTRQNMYLLLGGSTRRCAQWPAIVRELGGDPPSGPPAPSPVAVS